MEPGDAVTTGVPRRLACTVSTSLFDPELTPACRTDVAIDERARIRLLEERAVVALLISLWCVLIFGHFLSHLGGSLSNQGKRCCGSRRTRQTSDDNGSPGQWMPLNSRSPGHFHLPCSHA